MDPTNQNAPHHLTPEQQTLTRFTENLSLCIDVHQHQTVAQQLTALFESSILEEATACAGLVYWKRAMASPLHPAAAARVRLAHPPVRGFLAAAMVASKQLQDVCYDLQTFALVAGCPFHVMRALELDILLANAFRLSVKPRVYAQIMAVLQGPTYAQLTNHILLHNQPDLDALSSGSSGDTPHDIQPATATATTTAIATSTEPGSAPNDDSHPGDANGAH